MDLHVFMFVSKLPKSCPAEPDVVSAYIIHKLGLIFEGHDLISAPAMTQRATNLAVLQIVTSGSGCPRRRHPNELSHFRQCQSMLQSQCHRKRSSKFIKTFCISRDTKRFRYGLMS